MSAPAPLPRRRPGFDPKTRIAELRQLLKDNKAPPGQEKDVEEIIRLYETGEFDGTGLIYIQNGKLADRNNLDMNYRVLSEVSRQFHFWVTCLSVDIGLTYGGFDMQ